LAGDGGSRVFRQPVFAQGTLFVATETQGLSNFAARSGVAEHAQ